MKSVVSTTDLRDGGEDRHESWWGTIRADLSGASGLRLLAAALLLVWLAFQWGIGNESLTAWSSSVVFDSIDDRETWLQGLAAAGLAGFVGFLIWTITQTLDAVLVISGMALIPRSIDRVSRFLRQKGWVTPYSEMKWSTRWILAYATGASAVCLVDVLATGRSGLAGRRRMIVSSVLLSSVTIGAIVFLVGVAAVVAVRVPATADEAETFVRYARNPLTWIVIIGMVFLAGHLWSKLTSD